MMPRSKCEIRWCIGGRLNRAHIRVNEIIDDGSFATFICLPCANAIGIHEDQTLPEPNVVRALLLKARFEPTYEYETPEERDEWEWIEKMNEVRDK